jgi:hypothetical protein
MSAFEVEDFLHRVDVDVASARMNALVSFDHQIEEPR